VKLYFHSSKKCCLKSYVSTHVCKYVHTYSEIKKKKVIVNIISCHSILCQNVTLVTTFFLIWLYITGVFLAPKSRLGTHLRITAPVSCLILICIFTCFSAKWLFLILWECIGSVVCRGFVSSVIFFSSNWPFPCYILFVGNFSISQFYTCSIWSSIWRSNLIVEIKQPVKRSDLLNMWHFCVHVIGFVLDFHACRCYFVKILIRFL
jgi:hypothetical protein